MSGAFEERVAIAGYGDGLGALAARVFQGGDGEGGAAAGGYAYDYVVLSELAPSNFGAALLAGVFAGFGFGAECFGPAGDDVLDLGGIGIEGGWDFCGVQGADAAAGAGADVDEASTFAELRSDEVDGAADLGDGAANGGRDLGVFGVDDAGDLSARFQVEIGGRRVGAFGGEVLQWAGSFLHTSRFVHSARGSE